jgi:D-alanyl-D-alanine carboxypeptidase
MNPVRLVVGSLVAVLVAACGAAAPPSQPTASRPTGPLISPSPAPTTAPTASSTRPASFSIGEFGTAPTESFTTPVSTHLQSIIDAATANAVPGISATVLAAGRGGWTGVAGVSQAGVLIEPESKFGIASLTKTVVAAQVLSLAEHGAIDVDDPVADHLPGDFEFDANGATIRNLLTMESGIPDPAVPLSALDSDPARADWGPREVLATVPADRRPPGQDFVYEDANYMLLALVIEDTTGISTARALRAGVLSEPSMAQLVYQPEEKPGAPLAAPFGGAQRLPIFEAGGGYLPFAAAAGAANGSGGMASDAASLANFGWRLYGSDMLSAQSLAAMTDFATDSYGIGTFNQTNLANGFDVQAVGNGGWDDLGYSSALTVLPSEGVVIAVLTNSGNGPVQVVFPIVQQLADILDTELD